MSKVTFGFIVGGDDLYYKNLIRACESLERVKHPHEILIIDVDNRLSIDDPSVKIVNTPVKYIKNKDDRNWFQPHIWSQRYNLYKYVETDYCFYMDTDTVIINDRVDELINESEDKFLCTQHWFVPTLDKYLKNHLVDETGLSKYFPKDLSTYNYAASGAFMFQKEKHDCIFERYNEIFTDIFSDGGSHEGVTDELILCLTLNENGNYKFTNGAFNHTAAADYMPMKYENGIWYGKNPFDDEYKEIFLFHSACQNVHTLESHSPQFIEEIKKVMYWKKYI
jgi:hypothetical protein